MKYTITLSIKCGCHGEAIALSNRMFQDSFRAHVASRFVNTYTVEVLSDTHEESMAAMELAKACLE